MSTSAASYQKLYMRKWRERNREKWDAYMADYRQRNRSRLVQYRREHREEIKARKHKYLARKYAAEGSHTADEWRALVALYGGRCAYCGKTAKLEADHAIPITRGGTNYIDNIVPACRSCNSSKNDRTVEEFKSGMKRKILPRVPPGHKRCSGCKQILPFSAYWKDRSHPLGIQAKCKACQYAAHKAYLAKPEKREMRRAATRAWYKSK